jgi:hypothetical protein
MKAKFLTFVVAAAVASALASTSAFSKGSAASEARKECETKCNITGAPPSPQIQACYKKCDTNADAKK